MSQALTAASVLGSGLLLPHVAAFVDEGFTVKILKGHIPDEDLDELGLSPVAISAFRLRIWALCKLGDDTFHEKNDGVSSIDLLERRSPSVRTALTLKSEDLKKIFKRMATRRVFLNAVQQELSKTPAARPSSAHANPIGLANPAAGTTPVGA
ncbi:hypothetical protein CYMTET_42671 [Cymbomonas tetramitiformis]|uniref:Uncharacterized protein n=1 Tax=Cymbomonas tetramitiformis TaxID=36881 RepID=A0AAE0C3L2_9CHLO|nr:hypothetical protein CYMTET_42671 [Cymbomonas tetramitiformis]